MQTRSKTGSLPSRSCASPPARPSKRRARDPTSSHGRLKRTRDPQKRASSKLPAPLPRGYDAPTTSIPSHKRGSSSLTVDKSIEKTQSTQQSVQKPKQTPNPGCVSFLSLEKTQSTEKSVQKPKPASKPGFGLASKSKISATDFVEEEFVEEEENIDHDYRASPVLRPPPIPAREQLPGVSERETYKKFWEDLKKYDIERKAYSKAQAHRLALPTLRTSSVNSDVAPWHGGREKKAVLNASKFVLGLSSSIDGQVISNCCGLLIDCDVQRRLAYIITSTQIACEKPIDDDWMDGGEQIYRDEAKVCIYFPGGKTLDGQCLYLSKKYNVAILGAQINDPFEAPIFSTDAKYGDEIFSLVRNKDDFTCNYGRVLRSEVPSFRHHHFISHDCSSSKDGNGGTILDLNGCIVGLNFIELSKPMIFPSTLVLRCFRLWKKYGCIIRPNLGLEFRPVCWLDVTNHEKLISHYGISGGLIVYDVHQECIAEKSGFRKGDVVLSCQGRSMDTVVQLEEILLEVSERHLSKYPDWSGASTDVKLEVVHLPQNVRRIITLTVQLSEDPERQRSQSCLFTHD